MSISDQSHLFSIPEEITYLNCAYMSPQLRESSKKSIEYCLKKEQPWKIQVDDFFEPVERVRSLIAELLDSSSDNIALIPSVSYGIATAAHILSQCEIKSPGKILIIKDQFPSNFFTWEKFSNENGLELTIIQREPGLSYENALLEAIDENTRLIAIETCHWTDGTTIDLKKVGEKAHEVGAFFLLDGTQSIGASPFSIREVQADFLIGASYKWMFGCTGLSYMLIKDRFLDFEPWEMNWINRGNSRNFRRLLPYDPTYAKGARRFDMGERQQDSHLALLECSLNQILKWNVGEIHKSLCSMTKYLAESLKPLGYRANDFPSHMIGLVYEKGDLSDSLNEFLIREKIFVSLRGNSIRVSPHLYNTKAHLDKLIDALSR